MGNNISDYTVTTFVLNANRSSVPIAVVLFINLIHLVHEGIIYIKHLSSY